MPKRSRSKYNWPTIKQVYIIGKLNPETGASEDYTYNELAAMFNVKSGTSVRKRADKEGWNEEREVRKKTDEASLKLKLEEMKAQELPDIVEMRRRLLKVQLGTITAYLKQLDDGEVEVKPNDALKSSEFIIKEYYTLFGIPQPPVEKEDKGVELKLGKIDDLYDLANNIRRK
mgnify:CR=1 FL=1|jgi:hypothetical protein